MTAYQRVLEALFQRTTSGFKLGLDTTRSLLRALGDPQNQTPNIVVAGTNGKGFTSSLLAALLHNSGYRVGLFTSPHLLRFTERIRINDEEIAPEAVVELFERLTRAEAGCNHQPTYFECVTAMAALTFAEADVDIAVYEVGLGGRLDATNVLPKELAIITPIALDHQRFLGDTLDAIAAEKAGIIPPNGTVVSSNQAPEAMTTIRQIAAQQGAKLVEASPAVLKDGELVLRRNGLTDPIRTSHPPSGSFQYQNVATVIAACDALDALGWRWKPDVLDTTLRNFTWLGRFQFIAGHPDVLLDGAHNPAAITSLIEAIHQDPRTRDKPIHTIFSTLRTKTVAPMLGTISEHSRSVTLCPTSVSRTLSQSELRDLPGSHPVYESSAEALASAQEAARRDGGYVLVTGSLFLVADALAALTGVRRDPPVAS